MTASPDPRSPAPRRTRRKLTTAEYQALGAFRQALRRFLAFSEAGAKAQGLTPQQHQALLAVRAHPGPAGMTVSQLAAWLGIKTHSALGLVDRMVERGLLARAAAAEDRRRVVLSLTETGRRKLESIARNNLGQLQTNLPAFTELTKALEQLELPGPEAARRPGSPATEPAPRARRSRR